MLAPVFDGAKVEGVQVDGADWGRLLDSGNVVFLQRCQDSLPDFQSVDVPIHLRVLRLDENAPEPPVGVPLALVLLIKFDDHFDDFVQSGHPEQVVEKGEPARILVLLDLEGAQFAEGELIRPPVCVVLAIDCPSGVSGLELFFALNIGYPG